MFTPGIGLSTWLQFPAIYLRLDTFEGSGQLDCFSLCPCPPQTSIPSLNPEPYLSLASHAVTPKFTYSNTVNHRKDWQALGCRLINREARAAPESWSSQGRELCTVWAQTPKPWKPVHLHQCSARKGLVSPCRKNKQPHVVVRTTKTLSVVPIGTQVW